MKFPKLLLGILNNSPVSHNFFLKYKLIFVKFRLKSLSALFFDQSWIRLMRFFVDRTSF